MASRKARTTARLAELPAFEKKAFYAPGEIAEILGISTQTVLDRIHDGKLYAIQVSPRIYRIPLAAFMQFLGSRPRITRFVRQVERLPDWGRETARGILTPRK